MDSPLHIALGLTDDEFAEIIGILGREPNHLELAMYSVMWSEHCSYKSSRIHLRRFPTSAPHVIMGPGENAGVIDVGEGFAVAIRMESHNHPSAIEPYQGAATGVGGILRDIFTVGARPVALLDSLWMGDQSDPRNRWVFDGVVRGISGYGNAVGVPTVGGEIAFRSGFGGNPLVNVAAIGVAPIERLVRATASGVGNVVILLGASTGRDGIGGVSVLASAGFDDALDDEKRPSVQVGDPFEEKKLIEACLELLDSSLVVGIQDLGGAGLSCATSETASNGGVGMEVYLDKVPLREAAMEPFEIMTSESQERMLAIVAPHNVAEVLEICDRWEVVATPIGEVVAPEERQGKMTGMLRIFTEKNGELLGEVPASSLADEAPLYDRPYHAPSDLEAKRLEVPTQNVSSESLERYVVSRQFDARTIYRQYDHQLFLNTLIGPGADAALLRVAAPGVGSSGVAMGVSVDGNPRWCAVDPRLGAKATVCESALNVASVGARPAAVVDCLNFGNPTHPEVMWQLREAIEGISLACEGLSIPVIGGNVSLYNESLGEDIEPTPTVGVIGIRSMPSADELHIGVNGGMSVVVVGSDPTTLVGSDLAFELLECRGGVLFDIDLAEVERLIGFAVTIKSQTQFGVGRIHNVSSGGVVQSVIDLSLQHGLGVRVSIPEADDLTWCFGETPNRVVIVTDSPSEVVSEASRHELVSKVIGVMDGDTVRFGELVELSLAELGEVHGSSVTK